MKKYVLFGLALMISAFAIAQKKELKEAEKALKSNDFVSAKSALSAAEAMASSMDDKTKAKFYYLKGQALYANGTGDDNDIAASLENFKMLAEVEGKSGKLVYSPKADLMKVTMSNGFLDKAQTA